MDADIAWEECIPDLPLDTHHLPPLNALSSSSDSSLQPLDLIDLLAFEHAPDNPDPAPEKHPLPEPFTPPAHSDTDTNPNDSLSHCTANSATHSANSDLTPNQKPLSTSAAPPSHTSVTHTDRTARPHHRPGPPHSSQSDLVLELSTRLASAGAEAAALRKRVAALSQENRSLRAALDHANARLVAVAQAAAAQPPAASPVVLGLAQLSTDVATRLSGALTVSDPTDDSPRDRKKRKRVTGAATTMACVMFMWGAFVGTPGLLKGSTSTFRSDANLPAVWKGDTTSSAVAPVPVNRVIKDEDQPWQPNCMRVLQELPDGTETKPEDTMDVDEAPREEDQQDDTSGAKTMFVDMEDKAAANVVAHADRRDPRHPQYSYVLCRDADAAVDSVKACANKVKNGEECGQPHTISLILPAAAAGLDDNDTKSIGEPALAEVQCSILSVARIPSPNSKTGSKYGRIIATVPETGTIIPE